MKEMKLSPVQEELLEEYIESTLFPSINAVWALAVSLEEKQTAIEVISLCCEQDQDTFLNTLCSCYETRSAKQISKPTPISNIENFLNAFDSYRVKSRPDRFSFFSGNRKLIDNYIIITGLLGINSAFHSPKNYFMKAVAYDQRLNTKLPGFSDKDWCDQLAGLLRKKMKERVAQWLAEKKGVKIPEEKVSKGLMK